MPLRLNPGLTHGHKGQEIDASQPLIIKQSCFIEGPGGGWGVSGGGVCFMLVLFTQRLDGH